MSAAGPLQGRPREQGEAEARSARLRAWTTDEAEARRMAVRSLEAANCSPSGGSAAARAASVGAHQ